MTITIADWISIGQPIGVPSIVWAAAFSLLSPLILSTIKTLLLTGLVSRNPIFLPC